MDMDSYYFILEGHTPKAVSLREWGKWMEVNRMNKNVADDTINGTRVSTVFLGSDHGFGSGSPVLFETMMFDAEGDTAHDEYQERYCTWEEAEEGHRRAVIKLEHASNERMKNA